MTILFICIYVFIVTTSLLISFGALRRLISPARLPRARAVGRPRFLGPLFLILLGAVIGQLSDLVVEFWFDDEPQVSVRGCAESTAQIISHLCTCGDLR